MAIKTKTELKTEFQLGAKPNEDAFVNLIDSMGGEIAASDITGITIVAGVVAVPATTPIVKITTTDSSDIDTITVTAAVMYKFVIINDTGGGVKFVSGGNLEFGQSISLADGEFMEVWAKSGSCYLDTIGAGVKGLKQVQGVSDSSVYLGEMAGDSTDETDTLNVGIGYYALEGANGSGNTAIGAGAGDGLTGDNNIYIGVEAGAGKTESDKLRIGNYASLATGIIEGNLVTKELDFYGIGQGLRSYHGADSLDDDATDTLDFSALIPDIISIELSVIYSATIYAAKITGTGTALQVSWADGAVFDIADTDTKFCVYWATNTLTIKNRLGGAATYMATIKYQKLA